MNRRPSASPTLLTSEQQIDLEAVRRAAVACEGIVRETPLLSSRTLSERVGASVLLKAENLQRTGSFKLRGALAKIDALGDEVRAIGVVTGSAGNHGQGVAYAARARNVRCEVFMPSTAPNQKVEACEEFGATVRLVGATVEEALAAAQRRAAAAGLAFIHPYDDLDVIAGQGGVGLELAAQAPRLGTVVVPVGGGGLISGVAVALAALRPDVRIVGVQAGGRSPASAEVPEDPAVDLHRSTIADGIAVKQPGLLTAPLMRRYVDELVVVSEDAIAAAMVLLLERAKIVVEGAGAVGVAALLTGAVAAEPGAATAVILSGGNVDAGLLASVARRQETEAGRRLAFVTRLPDQPGALASLLEVIGAARANLLDITHLREGIELHVRETAVQLVVETRGAVHAEQVLAAVHRAGYETEKLTWRTR